MSSGPPIPFTAAGRRLVLDPRRHRPSCGHVDDLGDPCSCGLAALVSDIEDEVAAAQYDRMCAAGWRRPLGSILRGRSGSVDGS